MSLRATVIVLRVANNPQTNGVVQTFSIGDYWAYAEKCPPIQMEWEEI